jgi:hypothetical protein
MISQRRLIILAIAILMVFGVMSPPVYAQDTPQPIREAAIAALNSAIPGIGRPDSWRHSIPGTSNNRNLGCPLATGGDLGRTVTVYTVWLNYEGTEYLIYVSEDASVVVPCDPKIPAPGETVSTLPAPTTCSFTAPSVTVYSQPNTTSSVMTTLTNTTGPIVGRSADFGWYQRGTGGWMQTLFITLQGNCSNLPITDGAVVAGNCTITALNANVRNQPVTTAAVVDTLTNETLAVIGRTTESDWYQIPTGNWVAASVITPSGNCNLVPVTGVSVQEFSDCPADFSGFMQPQLAVGMDGVVDDESNVPNRVRAQPETSAEILFQMRPGESFRVLSGPQCGNGIVWWQVETDDGEIGWTAESAFTDQDYYLQPLDPMVAFACPAGLVGYSPTHISLDDRPPGVNADVNLYAQPSTSSRIVAQIPAGNAFSFLDNGPVCNQNVVWYQLSFGEIGGWVHETDPVTGEYVLEPVNNLPIISGPFDSQRIASHTVSGVQAIGMIPFDGAQITRVVWSPDSTRIAVIADNKVQVVTDFQPDVAINNLLVTPIGFDATAIAFNQDGSLLAIGYNTGAIWVANLEALTVTPLANSHTSGVTDLVFNSRNFLASVSAAAPEAQTAQHTPTVKVWDVTNLPPNGQAPILIDAVNQPMSGVAFSIDESQIAVSTSNGVQLYNVQTGADGAFIPSVLVLGSGDVLMGETAWGGGVFFGDDTDVNVFNSTTNQTTIVARLPEGGAGIIDLDVTRIGDGFDVVAVVYVGAFEGQVAFFGATSTEALHVVEGDFADIAFNADGSVLAVVNNGNLELWTVAGSVPTPPDTDARG